MGLTKFNQKGFSLVEVVVSVGLLGAISLGVIALNSNQKKGQQGIKNAGDMLKVIQELRDVVTDPAACELNFVGKNINQSLESLKYANNEQAIIVGEKVAKDSYALESITIKEHDALKSSTKIEFLFTHLSEGTRSKSVKKTFNIFSHVLGTKVVDCLSPLELTAGGALVKSCLDVDPKNIGNCETNYTHIAEEVKRLYCETHPYLDYNPVTQECLPLDAFKTCTGGKVMKGYDATGRNLSCVDIPYRVFETVDRNFTPNPVQQKPCESWTLWTPDLSTQCSGVPVPQTRNCLDGGFPSIDSREMTGSSNSASCCGDWSPKESDYCPSEKIAQANSCGQSRVVDGTKNCGGWKRWRIYCFTEGTKVTLKNGEKQNIEDIQVHDEVLTFDESTGDQLARPVKEVFHHEASESILYTFRLLDGTTVTSNDKHLFYLPSLINYQSADSIYWRWRNGEQIHLLTENGKTELIGHISQEFKKVRLYNIHVHGVYDQNNREHELNHNFYANGILVHNEKAMWNEEEILENNDIKCCSDPEFNLTYPRGIFCSGTQEELNAYDVCAGR